MKSMEARIKQVEDLEDVINNAILKVFVAVDEMKLDSHDLTAIVDFLNDEILTRILFREDDKEFYKKEKE